MTHSEVINNLLNCLDRTGFQSGILSCLESVIEQAENPFNGKKMPLLKRKEIIRLKNALKKTAKKQDYDLEKIFLKLWWSRKKELNVIAAHLLPDVYSDNSKTAIESIKTLLWRIDNRRLCDEVVYALSKLIPDHVEIWKDCFKDWAKSDFKWNRLIGIMLIKKTAAALTLQIPELLKIVAFYMNETNAEIRVEVSKCINFMTEEWDLPVLRFLDKYRGEQDINTQLILQQSKL